MKYQDLRKLLEETEDKLSVFSSVEVLKKYNFTNGELYSLIKDFLSDENKVKLLEYPHFRKYDTYVLNIIQLIQDEKIKFEVLNNESIMDDLDAFHLPIITKGLSDDGKNKILNSKYFIQKLVPFNIKAIINSLTEAARVDILADKDRMLNEFHLTEFAIADITKALSNDQQKRTILNVYQFSDYLRQDIISTCGDETKLYFAKSKEITQLDKTKILALLSNDSLIDLFINNKEFLEENNIKPYMITKLLNEGQQRQFLEYLQKIDISSIQKKEILATLRPEVKESIDQLNWPAEYIPALNVGKIDFNSDIEFEYYRGLDNLIKVNPEGFSEQQRKRFMQLCGVCPNLQVVSTLSDIIEFVSKGSEYKEAEEWIESILEKINVNYSDAQKLAVIDNAIGKKISYSPNFDTEIFDPKESRALWKIISSGYGICNGIAKVEQYILNRVGIDSEIVGSKTHAFLRVKDIELPTENGETIKGDTIIDPTWNLAAQKFGAMPTNFCISYEQARKNDIDSEGRDNQCHKNDEKLQDVTLSLDEKSLRYLFRSVGLADKQGNFPIKNFIDMCEILDEAYLGDPQTNIKNRLLLLSKYYPGFEKAPNSTMKILNNVFSGKNLKFNQCIINRVYEKEDEKKEPKVFVYIESNELGEKFYLLDKAEGKFIDLPKEQFVEKFDCYEYDKKNNDRIKILGKQ